MTGCVQLSVLSSMVHSFEDPDSQGVRCLKPNWVKLNSPSQSRLFWGLPLSIVDANPYESPKSQDVSTLSVVCNFCGKSTPNAVLVQAPGQQVYICACCARIAGSEIERHKATSLPLVFLSLVLGMSLLVLVPINWFLWDDESEVGLALSFIGLAVGMLFLRHCIAAVHARIRRPIQTCRNTVSDSNMLADEGNTTNP